VGFSAVILANGEWREREVGVPEDRAVSARARYQNPVIYCYNQRTKKLSGPPEHETTDEAVVVGCGLASIDVVKVLQLERQRALRLAASETACMSWKRVFSAV